MSKRDIKAKRWERREGKRHINATCQGGFRSCLGISVVKDGYLSRKTALKLIQHLVSRGVHWSEFRNVDWVVIERLR